MRLKEHADAQRCVHVVGDMDLRFLVSILRRRVARVACALASTTEKRSDTSRRQNHRKNQHFENNPKRFDPTCHVLRSVDSQTHNTQLFIGMAIMQTGTINVAGSVVFWNCAVETDRPELQARLTEIGFENVLPHERTAFAAAKQACVKHYRGDGYRVEKLKDCNGVTVEQITRGDIENTYTQVAYMIVNDDDRTVEKCRVIQDGVNTHEVESELISAFEIELNLCAANAIGMALAKTIECHDGYHLRPMGGVYFLPNYKSESFEKVAAAFESCGVGGRTMVHRMEVASTDNTLRSVHHAIRERMSERIAEMKQELVDGLGKAGRKNRKAEVEALLEQTKRYESLLSESLSEVQTDLNEVMTQLGRESINAAGSLFAGVDLEAELAA